MATITDLANNAAAVAAGYTRTQTDGGAAQNPRYRTVYDAPIFGSNTDDMAILRAYGVSNVDQATADAAALSSLNAQRKHTFGGSPGRPDGSNDSPTGRGGSRTVK